MDRFNEAVTGQLENEERGMEGEGKGANGGSGGAPDSLQPCSAGGSLLPALDQDSLECEARVSVWGIRRNV